MTREPFFSPIFLFTVKRENVKTYRHTEKDLTSSMGQEKRSTVVYGVTLQIGLTS